MLLRPLKVVLVGGEEIWEYRLGDLCYPDRYARPVPRLGAEKILIGRAEYSYVLLSQGLRPATVLAIETVLKTIKVTFDGDELSATSCFLIKEAQAALEEMSFGATFPSQPIDDKEQALEMLASQRHAARLVINDRWLQATGKSPHFVVDSLSNKARGTAWFQIIAAQEGGSGFLPAISQ